MPTARIVVMKIWLVCLVSISSVQCFFDEYKVAKAYHVGDIDQAEMLVKKSLIDNINDSQLLFDAGDIAYQKGLYVQARAYFNRAIEHCLQSSELYKKAWFNSGNCLLHTKDFKKAIEAYDHVLEVDKDNKAALYNKKKAEGLLKEQERDQRKNSQSEQQREDDDQKKDSEKKEKQKKDQQKEQSKDSKKDPKNDSKNDSSDKNEMNKDQQNDDKQQNQDQNGNQDNQNSDKSDQKNNQSTKDNAAQDNQGAQQQDQNKNTEQQEQSGSDQHNDKQNKQEKKTDASDSALKEEQQKEQQKSDTTKQPLSDKENAHKETVKKQQPLYAQDEPQEQSEDKDAEALYMKAIENADKDSGKYLFKRMIRGSKHETGTRNW